MEKMMFSSDEITNSIKETVARGGSFPLVVTGTSMLPFLEDGKDVVWLSACRPENIKKGDILLFERNDGKLVLHRVSQVLPNGMFEMNGDGLSWSEKIDAQSIIAVVTYIERNGKKLPCDNSFYNLKVSLWQSMMPVRGYIMKLYRIFR